eukprot:3934094-Rhodomonas_salina.9
MAASTGWTLTPLFNLEHKSGMCPAISHCRQNHPVNPWSDWLCFDYYSRFTGCSRVPLATASYLDPLVSLPNSRTASRVAWGKNASTHNALSARCAHAGHTRCVLSHPCIVIMIIWL